MNHLPSFSRPKNQLTQGALKLPGGVKSWCPVYAVFALVRGTARGVRAVQAGTAAELARSTIGLAPQNPIETSARYTTLKVSVTPTTSPVEYTR